MIVLCTEMPGQREWSYLVLTVQSVLRASGQCVLSASGKGLTVTSVMALENYRTYSKPDTVSSMCLGKTAVAKDSSFISNLAYQY